MNCVSVLMYETRLSSYEHTYRPFMETFFLRKRWQNIVKMADFVGMC